MVRATSRPCKHKKGTIPREGEFIITNCVPGANTWHVAQVTEVLLDKIKVNYYSTQGQSLEGHANTSQDSRINRLADISFLRTWCLENGRGKATTKPPKRAVRRTKDLWKGQLPNIELDRTILVRNVGMTGAGVLDITPAALASKLNMPHHQGAGGEDDFVDKPTFERHMRKNKLIERKRSLRNKR